jgi:transposase
MYIYILHRFREAVRRKVPEKWRTSRWCLLYDNAPAHQTVSVKDFLTNNHVTTLEHPPYSPDQAAADLYLFP